MDGLSTTAYVKRALELAGRQTLKQPPAEPHWEDEGPVAVTVRRP